MSVWRRVGGLMRLFDGQPEALPTRWELFRFGGNLPSSVGPRWKASVSTDAAWGGTTRASFRIDEESKRGVFEGVVSHEPLEKDAATSRLGFAALILEQADGGDMDCEDYSTLVIRAQTDGRLYGVTLKGVAPFAPELAYQGYVNAKTDGLASLILPFENFLATRGGMITSHQRVLDTARFNGIAFTLADPNFHGPFRLDIDSIFVTNEDPDAAAKALPPEDDRPEWQKENDFDSIYKPGPSYSDSPDSPSAR